MGAIDRFIRLPARSAAFWFAVAAAFVSAGVLVGAINNHVVFSRVAHQLDDSALELRCRAGSQVELEIATAQVTRAKARLDSAESVLIDLAFDQNHDAVPAQRAVVNNYRLQLDIQDVVLEHAIADREASLALCKDDPGSQGSPPTTLP